MPGQPAEVRQQRIAPVLALAGLGAFVTGLDATIVGAAVPSIGRDLGLGLAALSSVGVAYLVPFALLLPLAGSLGDRLDPTRTLLGALLLFSVGTTCSAVAANGTAVIGGRVLQGVAAAVLVPALLGLLRTRLDAGRRTVGVTVWAACLAVATALGPTVGGLLSELAGWRWVFLVNAPFLLVMLLLVPLAVGSGSRSAEPAGRPFAAFAVPVVRTAVIAQLLWGLGVSWVVFFTPLVHQEWLGMGPLAAGLSIAIVSLGIVAAAPFVPGALARFGPRRTFTTGLLTVAAGLLAVAAANGIPELGPRLPGLLLAGIGSALLIPLTSVVLDGVPASRAGGAAGLVTASGELAGALGIGVAGVLLSTVETARTAAGTAPAEALAGGYTAVLVVGAALQLAAAAFTWVRFRPGSLTVPEPRTAPGPPSPPAGAASPCLPSERFLAAFEPYGLAPRGAPAVLRAGRGHGVRRRVTRRHRPRAVAFDRDLLAAGRAEQAGPGAAAVRIYSVGHGVGQRVRIVDPTSGVPAGPGEVGEIWISGDNVGNGYWLQPEQSAEVFDRRIGDDPEPWMTTGDLGVLVDGELFVTWP